MPSRRDVSRHHAMHLKRSTDEFERMHRSAPELAWDDDEPDPNASTYAFAEKGPDPVPNWVITEDAARQFDLGILKTGKEADVHLVERTLGDRRNVLAAKRYRKFEDRMFRNDARYRAGRRTGDVRFDKAIDQGNRMGMAFRARQWLTTEFEMLCRLYEAGVSVPYPVQKWGNELMIELVGSPEEPALRLVHARLDRREAAEAWHQLTHAMRLMVRAGVVHADLSAYNVLWDDGRIVVIDFPQAVDPVANPDGIALLERDCVNVCDFFARRGVEASASDLFADLIGEVF